MWWPLKAVLALYWKTIEIMRELSINHIVQADAVFQSGSPTAVNSRTKWVGEPG